MTLQVIPLIGPPREALYKAFQLYCFVINSLIYRYEVLNGWKQAICDG
jgi:hypothetical protein